MTSEEVADKIRSNMEDNSIPKKIIECLRPFNGKKLTKKHIQLLKDTVDPSCGIEHPHHWTEITWGDNSSMTVAMKDVNVVIDVDHIIEGNLRYFSALEDRNKFREQLLNNHELLQQVSDSIVALKKAQETFDAVVKFETLKHEYYWISRLFDKKES
jgi:hypothetical protein